VEYVNNNSQPPFPGSRVVFRKNLDFIIAVRSIIVSIGIMKCSIVHEAELVNKSLYRKKSFYGKEDDNTPLKAVWMPFDYFKNGQAPLYPDGLLNMISDHQA